MKVSEMTDFVFIDSGLGGIPYMLSLLQERPYAHCIYVADTKNFPYGEKSHKQVIKCVLPLVKKISKKIKPKVIILACNTISVNALDILRRTFPKIQFVGTVPAIKLAASISKTRRLGLLATKATCENPYNIELKNKFAKDCILVCRDDGELVSFIEKNAFSANDEDIEKEIQPALDFFTKENCDVIILGCTHFLNISANFKKQCQGKISIVDSVDGVVRHALAVLDSLHPPLDSFSDSFFQDKSFEKPLLYVTKEECLNEKSQYKILCEKKNISFLGKL